MSQYDPQQDNLEEQAKTMAEFYEARLEKMGIEGITVCLARLAQINPPLHKELTKQLKEIRKRRK